MRSYLLALAFALSSGILLSQDFNIKVLTGTEIFFTKPLPIKYISVFEAKLSRGYIYNGFSNIFAIDFSFELKFRHNIGVRFDIDGGILSRYTPGFVAGLNYMLKKNLYLTGGLLFYRGLRYTFRREGDILSPYHGKFRWNVGFMLGYGFKIWKLPFFEFSARRSFGRIGVIEDYYPGVNVYGWMLRFSTVWEL